MNNETICIVDATSAPVKITLPYEYDTGNAYAGAKVIVKKVDTSANAVTVHSTFGIDGGGDYTIAGGSVGFVEFVRGLQSGGSRTWNLLGHS